MHPTSLENMQKCHDRFLVPSGLPEQGELLILDIGGADVNGSYREIFSDLPCRYLTADLAGSGVDITLTDPYQVPLPDASVDIVLSGQMLEHCEFFWLAFQEMIRLLKPEGFLFLIAPSAGPIHRYPVDCYRFYPDAFQALARYAHCHLEAVWRDERGPWQDLVGVFRKQPLPTLIDRADRMGQAHWPLTGGGNISWDPMEHASPEEEVVAGKWEYLEVLQLAHEILAPRLYLEIGVRRGRSLALSVGTSIGVDPAAEIGYPLPDSTRLFATTSDAFFEFDAPTAMGQQPLDLAFIDGMHLFEYALRDLMQVELRSGPATLVVIDDIYPNHPHQASRRRQTRVWTGDVWKLYPCLREYRPDLFLLPLDTSPTGLLLIAGLDRSNRVLWDWYNPIVRRFQEMPDDSPPNEVLRRSDAVNPDSPVVMALLRELRMLRDTGATSSQVVNRLHQITQGCQPPP